MTKILLLLSSYAPLFIIIGVKVSNSCLQNALWFISALTIVFLVFFLKVNKNTGTSTKRTIAEIERKDHEMMAYLVTYLIPFLGIDYSAVSDVVSIVILYGLVAVIYTTSDLIHINPTLNLLRYHIYQVTLEGDSKQVIVISRRKSFNNRQQLQLTQISDDVFLDIQ